MGDMITTLQEELRLSIAGLDSSQTQLRPRGGWSIQQIVEHLTLTYQSTEQVLDARLTKGRPTQARKSLKQQVAGTLVLRFGYIPPGQKAPAAVTPDADSEPRSGIGLAQAAESALGRMEEKLLVAEAEFGGGTKVATHSVLGPLSVDEWRRFHVAHTRHHLRQIRSVRWTELS